MLKQIVLGIFLTSLAVTATADVVVRLEIQQDTAVDDVFFRLFDSDAPLTVANFLGYVDNGDYDSSFIHRSVTNFVVQGGGFAFDPNLGAFINDPVLNDFPGGLQPITGPTILNEYGRSNLRGTVAMAKQAGDPDSATSQWFVNLADNSANLDNQNGGFTVFGEVLMTGMDVIDTIEAQPVYDRTDINTAFDTLPLTGYTSDPIQSENLVRINAADQLFTVTPDVEFGVVTPGSNVQPEVIVRNTGTENLLIDRIGEQNPVADPFRLVSGGCSDPLLEPGEECIITVVFEPQSTGDYTDSFDIAFQSPAVTYEVGLHGEGGPVVDEPDIVVSFTSVDFGRLDVLDPANGIPYTTQQIVQNIGSLSLEISSIEILGTDAQDFSLSGNCVDTTTLAPGTSCTLIIGFSPFTAGVKTAEISITTNDPDESPFTVRMRGTALGEDDGVADTIEDAGPNAGDGNGDGLLDSRQSNVTSLVNLRGSYVTFVGSDGERIGNMTVSDPSGFQGIPANADIHSGIYDFTVEDVQSGGYVDIGMILPAHESPVAFYLYGPSATDQSLHWHESVFDGNTGATIIGLASLTTSAGYSISRNFLSLRVRDGGPGDADQTVNGSVSIRGGVQIVIVDTSDSGSISMVTLIFTLMLVPALRISKRQPRKTDSACIDA